MREKRGFREKGVDLRGLSPLRAPETGGAETGVSGVRKVSAECKATAFASLMSASRCQKNCDLRQVKASIPVRLVIPQAGTVLLV